MVLTLYSIGYESFHYRSHRICRQRGGAGVTRCRTRGYRTRQERSQTRLATALPFVWGRTSQPPCKIAPPGPFREGVKRWSTDRGRWPRAPQQQVEIKRVSSTTLVYLESARGQEALEYDLLVVNSSKLWTRATSAFLPTRRGGGTSHRHSVLQRRK